MKTTAFAALFLASTLSVGTAAAQPAPFTAGQFRFAKADKAQVPTRGRVLDHFGGDVKDLRAVIARREGQGIKLDEPYRKSPNGNAVAYITDPWGARIELVERAPLY